MLCHAMGKPVWVFDGNNCLRYQWSVTVVRQAAVPGAVASICIGERRLWKERPDEPHDFEGIMEYILQLLNGNTIPPRTTNTNARIELARLRLLLIIKFHAFAWPDFRNHVEGINLAGMYFVFPSYSTLGRNFITEKINSMKSYFSFAATSFLRGLEQGKQHIMVTCSGICGSVNLRSNMFLTK